MKTADHADNTDQDGLGDTEIVPPAGEPWRGHNFTPIRGLRVIRGSHFPGKRRRPLHRRITRSRTNRRPPVPAGSVVFICCITLPSVSSTVLTPTVLHGPDRDSLHSTS